MYIVQVLTQQIILSLFKGRTSNFLLSKLMSCMCDSRVIWVVIVNFIITSQKLMFDKNTESH